MSDAPPYARTAIESMKLRWLKIILVMSLLLCVSTGGLWLRSYWVSDELVLSNEYTRETKLLSSSRGLICFSSAQFFNVGYGGPWFGHQTERPPRPVPWNQPSWLKRAGFGYETVAVPQTTQWWVASPLWFPLLLLGLVAVLSGRQLLRRIRADKDRGRRCVSCGYDLRATPDRCPECGTSVLKPAAPAAVVSGSTVVVQQPLEYAGLDVRHSRRHARFPDWLYIALVVLCYLTAIHGENEMPNGAHWNYEWERANFLMTIAALSSITLFIAGLREVLRAGLKRPSWVILGGTVMSGILPVLLKLSSKRWLQSNFP